MKWYAWIAAAIGTAIVGLFAAGTLGSLIVELYSISSFEGGSGFFVIGLSLLGGMAGFVLGLIASAIVSRRPSPGFLKALAAGSGAAVLIALIVAAGAWILADIPPRIQGDTLYLNVEVRWPPSGAPDPESLTGAGYLRLGAMSGSTVRKLEDGPLWLEDARQEDGRWIVPGAVHIFTTRGRRLIDLGAGDTHLASFIVPLPRRPKQDQETWSEWLGEPLRPVDRDPPAFTYRYRVVRESQPLRVERTGPFEIAAIVRGFFRVSDRDGTAGFSTFVVSHNGQPVDAIGQPSHVATVPRVSPTLFVRSEMPDGSIACHFIVDEAGRARVAPLGTCTSSAEILALTSDADRYRTAATRKALQGWLDRVSFDAPGLYQVGDVVVDTRNLTARSFTPPGEPHPHTGVPPLALSPDERSIVWFAHDGGEEQPALVVADTVANQSYSLPIDRSRMRFSRPETLDPSWVNHHFEWTRGADGVDRLQARAKFAVLPYKGEIDSDLPERTDYSVRPGGEPLRRAMIEILTGLGGERLPAADGDYFQRVRIDGVVVRIGLVETSAYVYLTPEAGTGTAEFMRALGARIDAALATGKWDDAFGWPAQPK